MMRMKQNKFSLMAKWIFFLALFFISTLCASPQTRDKYDALKGIWEGSRRETRDGETGETITIDGKPYNFDYLIEFRDEGVFYDINNNQVLNYAILDSGLLHVGNSFYVIEKLTSDSLVLLEYDKEDPDNPLVFRTYYKRR